MFLLTLALFTASYAQTRDKAQLDRRVAEYVWKPAYVLDADGSPYTEARVTERLLWLLCGETCQVTVRPAARLSKRVAPT